MGILRWLAGEPDDDPSDRSPTSPFWYTDPGSGLTIQRGGSRDALTIGAVYRCVNVLANAIAQLPLILYRREYDRDGNETGKARAKDHPLYRLVSLKPNAWQTGVEWRRQLAGLLMLRGNSHQLQVVGPGGQIEQLVSLRPDRIKTVQLESWRRRYRYTWDNGRPVDLLQDEVVHFSAFSTDGIEGLSPIELMRRTLETSIDMEDFQGREFNKAPKLAGFLKSALDEPDEAQRENEKQFAQRWGGRRGWGGVPILPPHLSWQAVGISQRDAQFLETRKFSVTDICRWFGVPPHLVADLEKATFSNIEHQSIDFLVHSVLPWLRLIEDRLTLDLCINAGEDDLFFEFLVDGLLRADSKTRAETQGIYLDKGVLNPNEVRALENRNPRRGGDEYLIQVNATRPMPPGQGGAAAPPAKAPPADDAAAEEDEEP